MAADWKLVEARDIVYGPWKNTSQKLDHCWEGVIISRQQYVTDSSLGFRYTLKKNG